MGGDIIGEADCLSRKRAEARIKPAPSPQQKPKASGLMAVRLVDRLCLIPHRLHFIEARIGEA